MVIISLWLFGALIGVAASQKKGFSLASGIIGGLLLGPLAFLMYFVSEKSTKKCPYCAEFIKADATICKFCHKDVPPASVLKAGLR